MNLLKRNLAPIPQESWDAIDKRATDVLKSCLSARKVVNVNGPYGINYTAVSEGRLDPTDNKPILAGTYKTKPLTEIRLPFTIDLNELDNIQRGAKDIDFETLEEATQKMALFEDDAIYNGFEKAGIIGLLHSSSHEPLTLGKDSTSIMDSVFNARVLLQKSYVCKPYTLIVGEEAFRRIDTQTDAYPLQKRIESLLGTELVFSPTLDGAIMVPLNSEDLELTIGQDLSIGYLSHTDESVTLFITESFTFRVLDPSIIIPFKL